MARVLWCRWDNCGEPLPVEAGKMPAVCPACHQQARWSSTPGNRIVPDYPDPTTPYTLTAKDRNFLRAQRIDAE